MALDRCYGDRPNATRGSDAVFLTAAIVLAALMFWRGIKAIGFLGGF